MQIVVLSGQRAYGYRVAPILGQLYDDSDIAHLFSLRGLSRRARQIARRGSCRTLNSRWRQEVQRLLTEATMVVFDARELTPNVREELDWVMEQGVREKTSFLALEDGRSPCLDDYPLAHGELNDLLAGQIFSESLFCLAHLFDGTDLERVPTRGLVLAAVMFHNASVGYQRVLEDLSEEEKRAYGKEPVELEIQRNLYLAARPRADYWDSVRAEGAQFVLPHWGPDMPPEIMQEFAMSADPPPDVRALIDFTAKQSRRQKRWWWR